jgi:LPXTG-site transpeptidase (sortase) family protein
VGIRWPGGVHGFSARGCLIEWAAPVISTVHLRAGWSLLALLLSTGCAAPAVPGTPPPQPTYPAVAPAGVPPVTGRGALAVVPANSSGAATPVTADLGDGWLTTVLVPASRTTPLAVRLQALPAPAVPAPPTSPPSRTALVLSLEIFDANTGAPVQSHPTPLTMGIRTPTDVDPATVSVLRFEETTGQYRGLIAALDTSNRVLSIGLAQPATLVLALTPGQVPARVASATQPAETPAPIAPRSAVSERPSRAPLPSRLRIPAIGVDAPITPIALEPSGIMASPTEGHVVGWYELGPRPGEPSNAVLAGHVDWQKQVAVFSRLRDLKSGDVVEVESGLGTRYGYVVETVQSYRADAAPVAEIFGPMPSATLTLITCGGPFDEARREYRDRVVLRARGT